MNGDALRLEIADARRAALQWRIFELENEVAELRSELIEKDRTLALLGAFEHVLIQAGALAEIADASAQRIEALTSSRAWKLVKPLLSGLLEPARAGRQAGILTDLETLGGQYRQWTGGGGRAALSADSLRESRELIHRAVPHAHEALVKNATVRKSVSPAMLRDLLKGTGPRPLTVGFAVTETDGASGAGDPFTAGELAQALAGSFGWKTALLGKNDQGADWYDVGELDCLVTLLPDFDLRRLGDAANGVLKVAWIRSWADRWLARPWFDAYDLVLCSSEKSAAYVRKRSGLAARVLRIASNTARFRPGLPPVAELESDYCFTGSHWGAPRTIDDLDPQRLPYRFSLFGHGWEERPRFSDSYRGPLAYERMPEVYASTKILVDDANHATRPWASVNSRVFDALACETLVITNGIEGARETFGDALPTYASVSELEEKLRYYLEHPAERERAAETLRRTVQERHGYMLRAEQFRDILADELTPRTRLEIRVPRSPTGSAGDSRALSFGIALADALRAAGYGVRVQVGDGARHGLFAPDAVITLGAAEAPVPFPGAVNLLWVIAPCDDLDPESLEAFDHVFTTSNLLARRWQEDLPESVEWLPPCTAVAPVEPPDGDVGGRLLFVGDAEGALDPLLRDALAAGYEVSAIGRGWAPFVAPAVVEAEYLDRESLRRLYPRCRAVLCAQSGEARAQGFPAPRALDVRAAGGVPVCAPVEGAEGFLESFAAIAQPGPDGLKAALDELPTRGARAPEHDGWLRRNSFSERAGVFGRTVDRLLAARRQ